MPHQVLEEMVEPLTMAAMRHQAPSASLSRAVPSACGQIWEAVKRLGLREPGRMVAVYLDGLVTFDCGVLVPDRFEDAGPVFCSSTPSGLTAHLIHWGPYTGLSSAHTEIRQWCSDHGRRAIGPNWEIYGHWDENPARLRTDIYYLLQPPA